MSEVSIKDLARVASNIAKCAASWWLVLMCDPASMDADVSENTLKRFRDEIEKRLDLLKP